MAPADPSSPTTGSERRTGADRRALEAERVARREVEASLVRETALSRASALLASGSDDALPEILRIVGEATGVSRTYLFRVEEREAGGVRLRNTHEWCADGIPAQIHLLEDMPANAFPWWMQRLTEGATLAVPDVSRLGAEARAERETLESQGVQAVLAMPLLSREGTLLGFMGFDEVTGPRDWTRADQRALGTVAQMVARELDRRAGEEALRKSEERYRLATLATRDVVYDWDLSRGDLLLSTAVHTVLGHSPHGVASRDWWDGKIHPADLEPVLEARSRALAVDASWEWEYRVLRGDGEYAHVLDRGYIVRGASGEPIRMVGVVSDVSERRHMEERLRHAHKMEALGRLAGGVAHDFNNILSVILGGTEFLLEATATEDPRHPDLLELREAARHGASLTGQLLALGRRQVLEERVMDLGGVVKDMERLLGRVLGADIGLTADQSGEPLPVMADRNQLEQVLLNLAINARDAMPAGGTLRIFTDEFHLDADLETVSGTLSPGSYARLGVEDGGEGMEPEVLQRIFEPFFTTKPDGKGTGLGLATVYGIIQQSGGRIQVVSAPGTGTTFTIYLPLLPDEGGGPPGARPPGERKHGPEGPVGDTDVENRRALGADPGPESRTILVVEDDPGVAAMARRALQRSRYKVLVAHSAEEALETLRDGTARPDLLITDVLLPGVPGPELATRLRMEDPGLRVLFISGHPGAFAEGTALDPSAFLRKPFCIDDLLARVHDLLGPSAPSC
jgi:two-component system, cell cycle sensor histidine kinase and response regulator CckA